MCFWLASREVPAELAAARCWRWGLIGASHRWVVRRALFRPMRCKFRWASAVQWLVPLSVKTSEAYCSKHSFD
ncbi:hypothetical protein HaLaN_23773 [Haematococcus lacustris]|uniref:Uncharacterized protein n=1 Tax=Haematococcus lacustris TaxID=44745 RepID=A0A699ZTR8_HAELA|nr:hypothetical protein HaLaN_23773 [Haematococcus lacustris]